MEFLPVNEQLANDFESKLSRSPLYRSTDNFIAIYNGNLINKNNEAIDAVAKEITTVYKNISLMNKKFIVKSKEEVVSETFEVLFPHVSFIATLKRVAKDVLKDNYPAETKIVFTEAEQNVVQLLLPDAEGLEVYEGAEKLKNANRSISTNPFFLNQVEVEDYGEDGIAFLAKDVLKVDSSFITDIGELLETYLA